MITPLASAGIEQTLHLRHRGETRAEEHADAWLLLGSDPADWIRELAGWGSPLASIRLLPVPASSTDRRAVAALAVPHDAKAIRVGQRALAYHCLAGRIYLPAEAQLHPPLSDAEIGERFPWAFALIHPSIGLVGFEERDILRATDLFDAPPADHSTWDHAEAGVYSEPHVRDVRPELVPSFRQVIEAARGEIGGASPSELPPTPDESLAKQLGRQARLAGIESLRKLLPTTVGAASSGMMNKLSRWAARRADALRDQIAKARQRELVRLMRLLEENPDEGLRYALPLTGTNAGRGEVRGGSTLSRRDTNFNLGNLFGSQPTSFWETPMEAKQRLQARYRELANRELSLGRHRRAAYIFSELLGDHHHAASALAEGRFFREAATLYREKLRNAAAAAACLERGGLIQEAAEAYESLGQFEKAGDLHASLQSADEAARLYRAAVTACAARDDALGAARLFERKLADPDSALKRLDDAWNASSNQADACLLECFRLLGRLDRHEAAASRLIELRATAPRATKPAGLAKVLVDIGGEYATRDVRALARDAARVVAGYGLASEAHALEHSALLQVVAQSSVDDRLLYRDTMRFRNASTPKAPPRPPPAIAAALRDSNKRPRRTLSEVNRITLPGNGVDWRSIAPLENGFVALGVAQAAVVIARGDWNGQVQNVTLPFADAASVQFRMAGIDDLVVVAPLATPRRLPLSQLEAFASCSVLQIGYPSVLPAGDLFGIVADDSGVFNILSRSGDATITLDRVAREGRVNSTALLPFTPEDFSDANSLWMLAHGDHLLITVGRSLHWLTRGVLQRPLNLKSPARGISGPPRHTGLRVAIAFSDPGCAIAWPQQDDVKSFAMSIEAATPALLSDGLAVAIGSHAGSIYELNGRTPLQVGEATLELGPPAKVIVSDAARNRVAALYAYGVVLQLAVN